MLLEGQERVGDRIGWTLKGRRRGKEGAGHEQSHQQSPFYRSVATRHFSSPYSHAGAPLLLQIAVRRGWPSNGTWRAHCGKY